MSYDSKQCGSSCLPPILMAAGAFLSGCGAATGSNRYFVAAACVLVVMLVIAVAQGAVRVEIHLPFRSPR